MSAKQGKSGVQSWFVYRRLDSILLYSRLYSAMEGDKSTDKGKTLRGIMQITLEQLKKHFSWIDSERIETINLDTYEIRLLYGKYVFLVLMIRKGSKLEKLHQMQAKMLHIIETDAEGRLASQIDEPEILRDVWVKCEEKLRPFILHSF
ncbi:MAG: hypothetical protein ACXAB2_13715 [Candidatus Hodarchaeales archaeon]